MSLSADSRRACDRCLARSWLIERLSGPLDRVGKRLSAVLALPDEQMIAALAGRKQAEIEAEMRSLCLARIREPAASAGLGLICRCDPHYPARLLALEDAPPVLHVAGELERAMTLLGAEAVAIVGARRASGYGLEVARSLGRGLAAAGVTVVSGMALGIDSAAHAGALAAQGPTVAVLPAGAEKPYPASRRALYARIAVIGAIVSARPPGATPRRWAPPARNRMIAGLAMTTVVVEAAERSGALLTAACASELGRPLGAVPGRVTSPLAAGPHALLRSGAALVEGPQDVLDELFGEGAVRSPRITRPPLTAEAERLLGAIGAGHDNLAALDRAGFAADRILAGLSALELAGYVRREPGGRFSVVP